ncbi:FAD binding domain-containing protein [Methylobacterium sp. E-025]|uniref:FAD binding domain-containing protein n=1 Tax=Methylobacterium sp. E-025 TaxID=2836561 RepID=UPI001FB9D443|nr:FAD binding domain-containing protein [Methylobacterium sp. E-025]MCJ2114450.1 FAD binding domain-containing protein [Methylobacterium sp. E-025]
MDLDTISSVLTPREPGSLPGWRAGDAWLAGGTWLFSEPQPHLARLIDLTALALPPSAATEAGLILSATCTIAELDRIELPPAWIAAPLVGQSCRALLGSFKIWNRATVGGNLCLALPAGPMIALAVALDGVCTIRTGAGGERRMAVAEFVLGPQATALAPDEVLLRLDMPASALKRRAAFRRISLSPNGRSGALLIGTRDADGTRVVTVTASTRRPVRLVFPAPPSARDLADAIATRIDDALWYDDVHGAPDWRHHVTGLLAEEIRAELSEGA